MELLDKFQGAFLGCALGDALGRPFESSLFSDARLAPLVERRAAESSLWAYSDDTQMMYSVAESLLQKNTLDPEHFIQTLAKNYDPARGYGKGMKLVFQALERGASWQEAANSSWAEGSKGNGAAVRVLPIACAYHRQRDLLRKFVDASASVSHTNPIALKGALLQASALSYLFSVDDWRPDALLSLLQEEARGDEVFEPKISALCSLYQRGAEKEEAVRVLGNGSSAEESVPLAMFAFIRWAPDAESVIKNTIQCGGDTDSNAALSGALLGALLGASQLPTRWLDNLENGRQGRDYLRSLASRLAEMK